MDSFDTANRLNEQYLTQFSKLVYSRQYEPAMIALMEILHAVEVSGVSISVKANQAGVGRSMSVIASSATALLSDPGFGLNRQGFSALMTLKGHLRGIFAATGFRDMSHLVANVTNRTDRGMEIPDLHKFLLVCTLDIAPDDIVEIVSGLEEGTRFLFWLSCFDNKYVLSAREEALKHRMLDMVSTFSTVGANSISEMQAITRAWMHSSYLDFPNKHKIKSALNGVIQNTMKNQGVNPPALPNSRTLVSKPRLLVVLEMWRYNNAMYRCFASAISSLGSSFHLVAMINDNEPNNRALEMFDEVLSFSVDTQIKKLVGLIIKNKPDVIFYPSLGMQQSAIQFAQLRLAPIQMMSVGHPASSFSEEMDYVVFEQEMLGSPDCFTEKVLLARRGAISSLPPDAKPANHNLEKLDGTDTIAIAVNSMHFKLTHRFLEVCSDVQRQSKRRIQFHFLIGLNPFNRKGISRWIDSHVPGSIFYDHLDYDEYAAKIGECDLQLAPFPFGNTNSFIDAVRLGVPTVCMDGVEVHSHGDAVMSRRVGLPEFCVATNTQDYTHAVLRLIHEDTVRLEIRRELLESNAVEKLFEAADQKASQDFAALFSWVYKNHEKIQASEQKVWTVEQREESR